MKLVCVACHPDDEALSVGALLLRARDLQAEITLIWGTRGQGSRSEEAYARSMEALELASIVGAKCVWLDLEDGNVNLSTVLRSVEAQIRAISPDVVVWPYGNGAEHHQDHRVLHEAMLNISKRAPYEPTCWMVGQPPVYDDAGFKPNLFLGVAEKRLQEVQALMSCYRSEARKRFAQPSFLEHRAARWANEGQTVSRFAEPFCLVKGVPPMGLFRTLVVQFSPPDENGSPLSFIESLEKEQQGAALALLEELSINGVDLPSEYSYEVTAEIRTLFTHFHNSGCLHFMYFVAPDRTLVVLHGFVNDGTSVDKEDVGIAQSRMSRWAMHRSQAERLIAVSTLPRPPRPAIIKTLERKPREGK